MTFGFCDIEGRSEKRIKKRRKRERGKECGIVSDGRLEKERRAFDPAAE